MGNDMESIDWEDVLESEEIEDEHVGNWRWGTIRRRIFRWGDKTLAVRYQTQPEEGIDTSLPPKPYEVRPVTKTVEVTTWEKV